MIYLSEDAKDMLINAEPRIGGPTGIGESMAELIGKGLASRNGNLTAKGLLLARGLQKEYFNA